MQTNQQGGEHCGYVVSSYGYSALNPADSMGTQYERWLLSSVLELSVLWINPIKDVESNCRFDSPFAHLSSS